MSHSEKMFFSKYEKRSLICTAITEKWPKYSNNILFLGEWCKIYDKKQIWQHLNYETFPFHWEDRKKRQLDHLYLNKMYELYLDRLSKLLNDYHNTNHTINFWRIVIGPWLIFYITSLFDRYEMLRLALSSDSSLDCSELQFNVDTSLAADFDSFCDLMASDNWNYDIYQRVLNFFNEIHFFNRTIQNIGKRRSILNTFICKKVPTIKWKLISLLDYFLNKRAKKNKILFFNSYFPIKTLFNLHQSLNLRFTLYSNLFIYNKSNDINHKIRNIKLKFNYIDYFDNFLSQNIMIDVPKSYIETFTPIYLFGLQNNLKPQYIVTANAYWNNDVFKIWAASLIDSNESSLIVLEHGGGLHHLDNIFGHDTKIPKIFISWVKSSWPNQIQLPANKFLDQNFTFTSGSNLLIIGTEENRYAYKSASSPISSLSLAGIDLMIKIIQKINDEIKDKVIVRTYNNPNGWNSELRIKSSIPNIKFINNISFNKIFNNIKIIICTQPQTSYSECLLTNLPTVLVFHKQLYEFDTKIIDLINNMYECKMIFYDDVQASKHVNSIWNNPNVWWESHKVKNCRERFFSEAVIHKKDGFSDWVNYFNNLIN